jgi:hypothetical protein
MDVRFEVPTAVKMSVLLFWVVIPYLIVPASPHGITTQSSISMTMDET